MGKGNGPFHSAIDGIMFPASHAIGERVSSSDTDLRPQGDPPSHSQCSSNLHRPGAVESSCESNPWRPTQKSYSSRIRLRCTALVTFAGERQPEPDPL